ncbi:MAG: VCBS repeat-containing protein [Deltaproteobacteria bacterium]|nr:VCBS repeat-containing protein [Deltaproteobacteria bacterium]
MWIKKSGEACSGLCSILSAMSVVWILASGCGGEAPAAKPQETPKKQSSGNKADDSAASDTAPTGFVGKSGRTLLMTQSNFKQDKDGKWVLPDSGELIMLQPAENMWKTEHIKETVSNVIHKALPYGDGIVTIGANEAMLKLWTKKGDKWESQTIWNPTFGGEHNRLRDFEKADFDGDGNEDLAIATHDQGVVAVAFNRGDKWDVKEIDRQKDIFVHEIEVGDLDKDGNPEIYATPSEPNTSTGVDQGGGVVRYEWNGESFDKSEVVHYDKRHIKEVLVADVDGDGAQELYASLEAEMGQNFAIITPVEIMRYDLKGEKFESRKVFTINDRFCRFLTAGDVDGDGKTELVASAFTAGVWVMDSGAGEYTGTCIDKETGGFEHATYLADMNDDNNLEIYVADDKNGVLRQYVYKDGTYQSKVIFKRYVPKAAMVWNITVADL